MVVNVRIRGEVFEGGVAGARTLAEKLPDPRGSAAPVVILRLRGYSPAGATFIAVLDRDAKDAQAGVQLVLAQPSISSQMVDNLNASIHLRALLTDLFLIDEIVRPDAVESASANAPTE